MPDRGIDRDIGGEPDRETASTQHHAADAEARPEPRPSLLKVLLRNRHLQTHAAFAAEYERTARRIDRSLIGTAPGREQLQRWLSGRLKTQPRPHHCRVLELMFPGHTVRELLAPYDPHGGGGDGQAARSAPTRSAPRGAAVGTGPSGTLLDDPSAPGSEIDHPTGYPAPERSRTVRLGTTRLAAGVVALAWRGPDRLDAALDLATVGEGRLALLEHEADRLALRVVKVPPAGLLEETLLNVGTVTRLLAERQPAAVQRRLGRIAAKLATIVAEILFVENQFALARRWYRSALRTATETGDRRLADYVLANATYLPTYTGDPRDVLADVDPRLQTNPPPSPAVAWLWASKAKAHAALGERIGFEHAIAAARSALDRSPTELIHPGIFSFLPEKLAFYEARARVDLGDPEGAAEAASEALARYDLTDTTEPALVRLDHAAALAQSGHPDEACRVAIRALRDPFAYPGASVVIRAREFDRALGPTTPVIAEWRDVLAEVGAPDPTALTSVIDEVIRDTGPARPDPGDVPGEPPRSPEPR